MLPCAEQCAFNKVSGNNQTIIACFWRYVVMLHCPNASNGIPGIKKNDEYFSFVMPNLNDVEQYMVVDMVHPNIFSHLGANHIAIDHTSKILEE